jgi:MoaA/NifB/PqqE/SkfB family radical SAM enzyme
MCHFATNDRLRFKPYDLDPGSRGDIELTTVRHVASELFPRAHTLGLGCAAEPLLHPEFSKILRLSREHRVPNVWLQTNLLALSDAKAQAIVEHGVRTVSVSIDGTTRETYEHIRDGASWDRLHSCLELLRRTGMSSASAPPRLRITFVWMQSNRQELKSLPAFAASLGAREIDLRFVTPTVGVDNRSELLDATDSNELMDELWSVARDATTRGIRLSAYPAMEKERDADDSLAGRFRRKLWLLKSGIENPAQWRRSILERFAGCSFPGRTLLIRPNGAVLPCPFWEEEPIAVVPRDGHLEITGSDLLARISKGLRSGCPVGSCRTCSERKDAFFRPLMKARDRPAKPG